MRAPHETYHRLANNNTQTKAVADMQIATGTMCGTGSRQAGGGFSPIPSAKAFFGPLPATERGIEFTTNIPPTSKVTLQGMPCYWHEGTQGVRLHPDDSDYVCIPVTVTKIVY